MRKELAIKKMNTLGKVEKDNNFLKVVVNSHTIEARIKRDGTVNEVGIRMTGGDPTDPTPTSIWCDNLTQMIKYLKQSNIIA